MKKFFLLALAALLPGCSSPRLEGPLRLEEVQEGVAGRSRLIWAVQEDGSWETFRVFEKHGGVYAPADWEHTGRGTLTPRQMARLAAAVHARGDLFYEEGPCGLGTPAKVNPHTYELSYCFRACVHHGIPPNRGGDLEGHIVKWGLPEAPTSRKFARIAGLMVEFCKE